MERNINLIDKVNVMIEELTNAEKLVSGAAGIIFLVGVSVPLVQSYIERKARRGEFKLDEENRPIYFEHDYNIPIPIRWKGKWPYIEARISFKFPYSVK